MIHVTEGVKGLQFINELFCFDESTAATSHRKLASLAVDETAQTTFRPSESKAWRQYNNEAEDTYSSEISLGSIG